MIGMLCFALFPLAAQTTGGYGLVGSWSFDQNYGTVAPDLSGFGNDGRLVDGPSWFQLPSFLPEYCLLFDGINDHVVVTDRPSLNPADAITMAAWVQPSSVTTSGEVIAKSNGTNPQYELRVQAGGRLRFRIGGTILSGHTALTANGGWRLVAGTYDGATMNIYLDGTLDATMPKTGSMKDNGVDVWIGARRFQTPLPFAGLIRDVRIYNRALSATEIYAIWNPGQVVITTPTDRTLLPGDGLLITADVLNFSLPVAQVDFYESGNDQLLATVTEPPYAFVFYNQCFCNTTHYIYAVATDILGNVAVSNPDAFWVNFCDDSHALFWITGPSVVNYGDPIRIDILNNDPCRSWSGQGIDLYLGSPAIEIVHLDDYATEFIWENAPVGTHFIWARATRNDNVSSGFYITVLDPNN